jgi:hypothetical protein
MAYWLHGFIRVIWLLGLQNAIAEAILETIPKAERICPTKAMALIAEAFFN